MIEDINVVCLPTSARRPRAIPDDIIFWSFYFLFMCAVSKLNLEFRYIHVY